MGDEDGESDVDVNLASPSVRLDGGDEDELLVDDCGVVGVVALTLAAAFPLLQMLLGGEEDGEEEGVVAAEEDELLLDDDELEEDENKFASISATARGLLLGLNVNSSSSATPSLSCKFKMLSGVDVGVVTEVALLSYCDASFSEESLPEPSSSLPPMATPIGSSMIKLKLTLLINIQVSEFSLNIWRL